MPPPASATTAPLDIYPESVDQRVSLLLSRLNNVKASGKNQWFAECPCHDDRNGQSFAISVGDNGDRVLCYCFAGCDRHAVLGAVGLTEAVLFPPRDAAASTNGATATATPQRRIVATYDYRDADGSLVFQVVRYDPKDFRQRAPKEGGGWNWSIKGCKVVPYRLPELLAADRSKPVYVVEGEKDCDRLASLGLVATTSAMGAAAGSAKAKWKPEHAAYLRDRVVVVLPDNDAPGREHAAAVVASLKGVAAAAKIVELPGLPEKGDVSDWLDNGGTCEQLLTLSANAPSADAVEPVKVIGSADFFAANYQREYIIPGVLTAGEPCIIGGRSKTLKTTLAIDLALAIGMGGRFLGRWQSHQRTVAILSGESGDYTIQETARRIAFAHGYDPSAARVLWGFDLPCLGDDGGLASLTAMIAANKVEVLIVDPVYLALMGEQTRGLNASNLFDVGPLLLKIAAACKANGTTLILLHHCRKNSTNEKFSAPELEELSMSGFGEFARQWLLLGRRSQYQCDGEHALHLMIGGSAGHGGAYHLDISEGAGDVRTYTVSVQPASEATAEQEVKRDAEKQRRHAAKLDENKAKVLDAIKQFPGGETPTFFREKLFLSGQKFGAIAELLEHEGFIERCVVEKGGRKIKGWRQRTQYDLFTPDYLDSLASNPTNQGVRTPGQNSELSGCPGVSAIDDRTPGQAGYISRRDIPGVVRVSGSLPCGSDDHPADTIETCPGVRVSTDPPHCDHDWTLGPDTYREGWQRKFCKKCNELYGYLPPGEA